MPNVTIKGNVTPKEGHYEITTHGNGPQEVLTVKQSAVTTATVHLGQGGDITTFHVHGGGLIISRIVNELGIAKKVAAALKEAYATFPPADPRPS
jgi:hypothetical protein